MERTKKRTGVLVKRGGRHRMLEPRILLDSPSPIIQGMVDQVTEAGYTDYLTEITSFPDRNSYTEEIGRAADYIVGELEAMGLQVELQTFELPSIAPIDWNGGSYSAPVSNIIATIPGKVTPEQEYLLTAHYDSIAVYPGDYPDPFQMVVAMLSPSTPAPGADDNGSGTAALLESARVMSQYPFESTVKFVFFTAEEEGLVGSDLYTKYAYYEDPYAEEPVADPDDIRGAINYDMIAYWDGDPAGGETLDVIAYTGPTCGIDTYPNLEWIVESSNPDLTPEMVQYVIASLIVAIPPPPADSVDSSLLGTTFVSAADTYNTGLQIEYVEGTTSDEWWLLSASDHFNFWWYGWPALLCIEDLVYGIDDATGYPYTTVTNPYYHSIDDTVENANAKDLGTAATKTGLATIAEMAGVRVDVMDGGFDSGSLDLLYETEGDVAVVEVEPGNNAAQLTESSPAILSQELVVPSDADVLDFDFRFVDPGDGDFLTVEFNGDELSRIMGADIADSDWHSAQADVSAYAGQPGTLAFCLNSVGDPNAQYQVDNIGFPSSTSPPTVGSLAASPDPVAPTGQLTLTAENVEDTDGSVQLVEFYRDDGDGLFNEAADTLLGTDANGADDWSWTGSVAAWSPGSYTCFARAQDDDSLWSEAVSTTGTVERFTLISSHQYPDGPILSVYDVDASNGPSNPRIAWHPRDFVRGVTDVLVNPGRIGDDIIAFIALYGDGTETADLGIVAEENAGLLKFLDLRTGTPPLGFLVSDGDVGTVILKAGVTGADLNGFTTEGDWTLADDLDGDGDTDDLTALYVGGRIGSLISYGDVDGDVVVDGDLALIYVLGGDLNGDVVLTGSDLGKVIVRNGDITGNIQASGNIAMVYALGGGISGDVTANTGAITMVYARGGDVSGTVSAAGNVTKVYAIGGNVSGDVTSTGGGILMVYASGGDVSGAVSAPGNVSKVYAIGGDITGDVTSTGGAILMVYASGGDVSGAVSAPGNVSKVYAIGGNITGDVTSTAGSIVTVYARSAVAGGGSVTGDIRANRNLSALFAFDDLTGAVNVGGSLGKVAVYGDINDTAIDVTGGNFLSLYVGGTVANTDINVSGLFNSLYVRGDFYNSSIHAGTLRRVLVMGQITEDNTDGDRDEIRADEGRFFAMDRTWRGWIDDNIWGEHWFDEGIDEGVKTWVG